MLNYYLYRIKNSKFSIKNYLTKLITPLFTNNKFLKRKNKDINHRNYTKDQQKKIVYSLFEDIYKTLLKHFLKHINK